MNQGEILDGFLKSEKMNEYLHITIVAVIREVLARFATAITENCGITKKKNAVARQGAIFHDNRMGS